MMRNNDPQGVCFKQCSKNKINTCKVSEAITSLVCKDDINQENLNIFIQ